jgi:hypothetical protein
MSEQSSRGDLPLPDYDHLPLGSLTSRIRSLDAGQLSALVDYERAHGNRLPVVQALESRIDAVRAGADLSSGSPEALRPEAAPPPAGDTAASPATTGPAMNPPSHGDPTNPAQPRSTG